jgi:hypothetical protein
MFICYQIIMWCQIWNLPQRNGQLHRALRDLNSTFSSIGSGYIKAVQVQIIAPPAPPLHTPSCAY